MSMIYELVNPNYNFNFFGFSVEMKFGFGEVKFITKSYDRD